MCEVLVLKYVRGSFSPLGTETFREQSEIFLKHDEIHFIASEYIRLSS